MARRITWIVVAAFAAASLLSPALAATGSYSSSGKKTTLSVSNSGTGKALSAKSHTGNAGYFRRTYTSGTTAALLARNDSTSSYGSAIYGLSPFTGTATTYGVRGESASSSGRGVFGLATHGTGTSAGVFGQATSKAGRGVWGYASNSTGLAYGVYGRTDSRTAETAGVYGYASAGHLPGVGSPVTVGVLGRSTSSEGIGVTGFGGTGTSDGNGIGVYGKGTLYGIHGHGLRGPGIYGTGASDGILGEGPNGVRGVADGFGGIGVRGVGTGLGQYGVHSEGPLRLSNHIVGNSGFVAGTCTMTSVQTSKSCSFNGDLPSAYTPVVVLFPLGDPQGREFWISAPGPGGFTLNASSTPAETITFNWIAIGLAT